MKDSEKRYRGFLDEHETTEQRQLKEVKETLEEIKEILKKMQRGKYDS